ncbi:DNA repair protein RecN [Salipaludibacillus sp. LMS25]|jgi:DNA repair protein RecN (Recombination protein N)|uniref:DNA repair protein RecN n=1 Tax=Salipaludibacillus sp. LMS25 TaxID=2924031 RepID=UPI0020D1A7A7|nr:DNA repair protein RecN [Salipaludibacillus sp. LMS25]UTR14498.1 DNA repair protein RecN [Salipaludibacillus sp. LMS25]
MLMELSIRNFAIIDEISISFEEGLIVLTGETGAGKSIIIDAIGLLIGGRGSVDFVRHGSKRAEIEGMFSVEASISKELATLLEDMGIASNEEPTIVLRREMTTQGKSICRVNGKLTTLALLREVGQLLVDIHGQHEHQKLLQADKHLTFLDRYAGTSLDKTKREYEKLYDQFIKKREQLLQLSENEQQMAQRLDLIQYQFKEIENAKLELNEDKELDDERQKLNNSEALYKTVHGAYESLYGEGKGLEWAMTAMNQIEEAASMDPELQPVKETIANCYYLLEEASFSLRDYYEGIAFDPDRLNTIEARLSEISQLKRKYGDTVNDILEYAAAVEEEIDTLTNREQRLVQWEEELCSLVKDLTIEGEHLSQLRQKHAVKLKKAIQQQLKELYMKETVFDVAFNKVSATSVTIQQLLKSSPFTKTGMDQVSFMVATNQGEPLKPVAKVASGGEISRMILALKAILAKHEGVTSIIFDEVDTGVSGRVAQAIAEKIYRVSIGSQVLCITHLPQVAAMADTHLFIEKKQQNGRTQTVVRPLNEREQTEEISRMISGVEITDLTREHARELIIQAKETKLK